MESQSKRSMRNYLVSMDLQLQVLSRSFIYVCLMVMVSIGIILYPLIRDMLFDNDLERQYQAAQTFLSLAKWLVPAILLLLVLFVVHLAVITHRICGPLVNFTHTFDRLAEGDLTRRVRLRKGDYLTRECERINRMIDGLSGIVDRLLADHRRLTATLEELKEKVQGNEAQEKIEQGLELIRQEAAYVSQTLDCFKTSSQGGAK